MEVQKSQIFFTTGAELPDEISFRNKKYKLVESRLWYNQVDEFGNDRFIEELKVNYREGIPKNEAVVEIKSMIGIEDNEIIKVKFKPNSHKRKKQVDDDECRDNIIQKLKSIIEPHIIVFRKGCCSIIPKIKKFLKTLENDVVIDLENNKPPEIKSEPKSQETPPPTDFELDYDSITALMKKTYTTKHPTRNSLASIIHAVMNNERIITESQMTGIYKNTTVPVCDKIRGKINEIEVREQKLQERESEALNYIDKKITEIDEKTKQNYASTKTQNQFKKEIKKRECELKLMELDRDRWIDECYKKSKFIEKHKLTHEELEEMGQLKEELEEDIMERKRLIEIEEKNPGVLGGENKNAGETEVPTKVADW